MLYLLNLLCEINDLTLLSDYNKITDWSKHHKIDNPSDSKTF